MKNRKTVKCVIWDLDGTLWDGILLEGDRVRLKPGIRGLIKRLDSRGILHSIASKNDRETALAKLREFKLEEYFLYPEINWDPKSSHVERIGSRLNIGRDTLLFIDDLPQERAEVKSAFPEVWCLDAGKALSIASHPRLRPDIITADSRKRRLMYQQDDRRKTLEAGHRGPRREFLASLKMVLTISYAQEEDLRRAVELTVRTNQLNTTGRSYGYKELKSLLRSENHRLIVCELKDKYGSYGKIGLALIEITSTAWHIRLFLMSCRVMTYGIGTIVLSTIMARAAREGKTVSVDFVKTDKNRMMYVTLKFSRFRERVLGEKGKMLFEFDGSKVQEIPSFIKVRTPFDGGRPVHGNARQDKILHP